MNILCAYFNQEENFLNNDPVIELEKHNVSVVHEYEHLKNMFLLSTAENPMFDVVLTDVSLPAPTEGIVEFGKSGMRVRPDNSTYLCPTVLLEGYFRESFVRGLGVFIPSCYSATPFGQSDVYHSFCASKDCWDACGRRDWNKLLSHVVSKFR